MVNRQGRLYVRGEQRAAGLRVLRASYAHATKGTLDIKKRAQESESTTQYLGAHGAAKDWGGG